MTPEKTMHQRLETLFSSPDTLIHLDLNGLMCDYNPDLDNPSAFHTILVGTSSMTLKEEYASFVLSNDNVHSDQKYCAMCLYRLEKKLR